MTYKRYIRKNGKLLGPYYYKSVRGKNGRVRSVYVGKKNREKKPSVFHRHEILNTALFLFLLVVLALLKPEMIGLVVYENNNYIETVNFWFNESSSFAWAQEVNGSVTSLAITGTFNARSAEQQSSVTVFLDDDVPLLIYNTTVQFSNETEQAPFYNECVETCTFASNKTSHNFLIYLENAQLLLENITYQVTLQEPVLENGTTEQPFIISDTTTQGTAVVDFPVEWYRNILYSRTTSNATITLPPDSSLLNVYRNEGEDITEQTIILENASVFIPVDFTSLRIIYTTPGPRKEEFQLSENMKQIVITSYYSYQDVFAFTQLNDTSNLVQFYEIVDGQRNNYNANYNDTNQNGFIDRVEWMFSNKTAATFEVESQEISERFGEIFVQQATEQPLTMGGRDETISGIDYYPNYDVIKYNNSNRRQAVIYNSEVNIKNSSGTYAPFNEAVNLTVISNNFAWLLPNGNFSSKIFIHLTNGKDYGLTFLPVGTHTILSTNKIGKAWKYGLNVTNISLSFANTIEYLEFHYNGTFPVRLQERKAVLMNTTTNETYIFYYNNTVVNETVETDNLDLYLNNVTFTMPNASTLRITGITGLTSFFIDPVSTIYSSANADGQITYEEDDFTPISADATSALSLVGEDKQVFPTNIYRSYLSFNTSFIEDSWIINSATLDVVVDAYSADKDCTDGQNVYYMNASDSIGTALTTADGNFDGTYETLNWGGTTGTKSLAISNTSRINRNGMTDFELKGSWVPTACNYHQYYMRQTEYSGTDSDPKLTIDYRVPCSGNDYSGSGNWLINTTTICENTTIEVLGNINITAVDVGGPSQSLGNLTLRNVTLTFNTTSQSRLLAAQYIGTSTIGLYIINSTIQANWSGANIIFSVLKNTEFDMVNSTVKNVGFLDSYGLRGIDINTTKRAFVANSRLINTYYGFYTYSSNITIINTTIINATAIGFYCDHAENNTLENNTVNISGMSGIYIDNCSRTTVKGNNIINSSTFGIYCNYGNVNSITQNSVITPTRAGMSVQYCHNTTISRNTVYNSTREQGIEVIDSDDVKICNNNVTRNNLSGIDVSSSSQTTICNNTVGYNVQKGIYVLNSDSGTTIENNTVQWNTADGILLQSQTDSKGNTIRNNNASYNNGGIRLVNSYFNIVYNNTLNTLISTGYGITITDTTYSNISRNTINSPNGVLIRYSSANNTFIDNSITGITGHGVRVNTTSDTQTNNNTFINTTWTSILDQCVTNSTCELKIIWYLDVNVNNTDGALQNANVTTTDKNNTSRFSSLTGTNGRTRHNLTEFIFFNGSETVFKTPYTINITSPEHKTYTGQINITQSTELFIRIKDVPVVTLDTPGNNTPDADGNVVFFINITDETGIKNVTFYDNFTGTYDANVTFYPFNKNYLSPNAGFDVPNSTFDTSAGASDEGTWLIPSSLNWACNFVKGEAVSGGTNASNCTRSVNATTEQVVIRKFIVDKNTNAINGNFSIEPNTPYYFSGWIKTLMNSGGANFSFYSGGGTNCTTTPITYSTGWTFAMCNVTTASIVTNPYVEIRSVNSNGIKGSILVDNLSVTKINQSLPENYEDRPVYLSIEENANCTITDECSFLDGAVFYKYGIGCGANCFNYNGSSQTFYDDDALSCLDTNFCNASFTIVNLTYDGIFNLWAWQQDFIGDSLWWSADNTTYLRRQNASTQNWRLVLENVTVSNGNLTLYVKKNVSTNTAYFDRLRLVPVNPKPGNITRLRTNFTFTGIPNGRYYWNALAFDVLNKNAFADANYTLIVGTASVAIDASGNFSTIRWNITTVSGDQIEIQAESNNGTGASLYFVNISAAGTNADLYIKANGNLTSGGTIITLNNEKFAYNSTNSTVPPSHNQSLSTAYVQVGSSLPDASMVYFKFFLNVTSGASAGIYNNTVSVTVVSEGNPPP